MLDPISRDKVSVSIFKLQRLANLLLLFLKLIKHWLLRIFIYSNSIYNFDLIKIFKGDNQKK